jgi:hypothetical protein
MVKLPRRVPVRGGAPAADDPVGLAARYPDWFALGTIAPLPGWSALVDGLFAELAATLDEPDRARLQIAAVRERDGRLQIETYVEVPAARKLIARAITASARICQHCGAPGRRKTFAGWSATLCAACRKRWGAMTIGAKL